MSYVLDSRYEQVVHRLALGLEPWDATRDARVEGDLRVTLEHPSRLRHASLVRHPGGRLSLRYVPHLPAVVQVLIDDPLRRFVGRRLAIPIPAEADVPTVADRTWRPRLFPGAAYSTLGATGLRGAAVHAGAPAAYARVDAVVQGTTRVVGRAHGDDRGEFLLIVWPDPGAPAQLPDRVHLTVRVRAADPVAADVPTETLAPPGPDDPVSAGTQLPPGYAPGLAAARDVDLVPGRIQTGLAPFDLA